MGNIKKQNIYPNPSFKTLEEEEKYWAKHSPLKEGYQPVVQRKEQKRSSFLSVRLTAEKLKHLQDSAQDLGLKPSDIIRIALRNFLKSKPGIPDANTAGSNLIVAPLVSSHKFAMVREKGELYTGDKIDEKSFYVISPEKLGVVVNSALGVVCADNIITPKDKHYKTLERIAREKQKAKT